MAVPIDRQLVHAMVEERFGSVDNLCAAWTVQHQNDPKRALKPRDRSTVYKWLDTGLPAKPDILFGFCSLLDVDPIGIVQSDKDFIEQNFAKERRAFQVSEKGDTVLAPFRVIYFPWWSWPNQKISNKYFHRDWFVEEFLYEPGNIANVYAGLLLSTRGDLSISRPHVYHIAYQQKNAIDRLWRPYGVIISRGQAIRLISESGDWQEIVVRADSPYAPVETFFGPRATRFRLASLHEFAMSVQVPSRFEQAVRFH